MGFGAADRGRHIALAALLLPAAVPRPATFSHDGGREARRHLELEVLYSSFIAVIVDVSLEFVS